MNLQTYKDVSFFESTPRIVREAVIDCIERKVLVHVLIGDPLTGKICPSFNSTGIIVVSDKGKPVPILRAKRVFTPDGDYAPAGVEKLKTLRTDKILKIVEVDTCKLLFQSYECQSSPLEFVIEASPYSGVPYKACIRCSNPEKVIKVPPDINVRDAFDFLFGHTHFLPRLMSVNNGR